MKIRRTNRDLDVAVVEVDGLELEALPRGSADGLQINSHVAVIGFPNYRPGDSGVLVPGLVVGFRPRSGARSSSQSRC